MSSGLPPSRQLAETLDGSPSAARLGQPGRVLAERYELIDRLGAGGMGEVWRARHLVLGKEVAVKLLLGWAPALRERFLLEAKLLASIRHPNVVEIFDFGETTSGDSFFVMELLRGRSLRERIEQGPLSVTEGVEIALGFLDGLCAVHAAGIIHRDVKPDNILLVETSQGVSPKLVDFGVALVRNNARRLTQAGAIVGTPEYMAPEIVRSEDPDERADVYGAALTLYESITGVSPFRRSDVVPSFRAVVDDPIPFPTGLERFDSKLWAILLRALSKARDDRPASARELGLALTGWLERRALRDAGHALPAPPSSAGAAPPPPSSVAPELRPPPSTTLPSSQAGENLDALIKKKLGAG